MEAEAPRNQFDGEFAALEHQREMDALGVSGPAKLLGDIAGLAADYGVPIVGLFKKAVTSGQAPVEKVIEQIESAACDQFARIHRTLENNQALIDEFEMRLRSNEAQTAYLSAVLHGLRTSDPQKHARLGTVTINSVYVNDLEPETLDELMRAAVELKQRDIDLLRAIYDAQIGLLTAGKFLSAEWSQQIALSWSDRFSYLDSPEFLETRGSLGKLQSLGLIGAVETMVRGGSLRQQPFGLLLEGKKFCERLRMIGTEGIAANVGSKVR